MSHNATQIATEWQKFFIQTHVYDMTEVYVDFDKALEFSVPDKISTAAKDFGALVAKVMLNNDWVQGSYFDKYKLPDGTEDRILVRVYAAMVGLIDKQYLTGDMFDAPDIKYWHDLFKKF